MIKARETKMLASVLSASEAKICLNAGADIIDCKDPGSGALGALPPQVIREIVKAVGGAKPVSATIGDLPCAVEPVVNAVRTTAQLGLEYVKVGLFVESESISGSHDSVEDVIRALGNLNLSQTGLVAVLLADKHYDVAIIKHLAKAGFQGVLLDTADKSAGSLLDVLGAAAIKQFVSTARNHGLFSGLAGRLRHQHIPQVLAIEPDIIGFRGALCASGNRAHGLDDEALAAVRRAIPTANPIGSVALKRPQHNSGANKKQNVAAAT